MPEKKISLYQQILGPAWNGLPPEIRAMHQVESTAEAQGTATIKRGQNPLAKLACLLLGMPPAGENIPVTVKFTAENGGETWARNFAASNFNSFQYAGRGRFEGLVNERIGMLTFGMALVFENGRLKLVLRRWNFLGIPMPMGLCVKSDSFEAVENGRFTFNVRISHPLIGLIIHYQGWLERKA